MVMAIHDNHLLHEQTCVMCWLITLLMCERQGADATSNTAAPASWWHSVRSSMSLVTGAFSGPSGAALEHHGLQPVVHWEVAPASQPAEAMQICKGVALQAQGQRP